MTLEPGPTSGNDKLRRNVIYYSKSSSLYVLSCFILALIFAYVLAFLPVDAFVDRDNYLRYASSSAEIFERGLNEGWLYLFINEPVWLLVNIAFSFLFSDENVVRSIIFLSAFITSFLTLKLDSRFFFVLLLFLLLPQVLKNYIVHLRQGLAVAIFMLGWFARGKKVRRLLIILTPFIHASFFFVLIIYYYSVLLAWLRFSSGVRLVAFAIIGTGAAFTTLWLASNLGARQAGVYETANLQISGLGFAYWFVILLLFVLQGAIYLKNNGFQVGMLVFYLAIYFFLPISARIFESAVLLVLISGLRLTSWRFFLFILSLLLYFVTQWVPRFSQSGFGWGVENYLS
ncbi:EpsG family protein [Pseudomonas mediterranea]|uniref:EpsG family protein n=1 Tax=Pseudomonas mediterranea TaxID=183795 RepID=UPI0009EC6289|nr:EpsG family protein [Pseudomonas mediterranea]